jgi:hypothetical protein
MSQNYRQKFPSQKINPKLIEEKFQVESNMLSLFAKVKTCNTVQKRGRSDGNSSLLRTGQFTHGRQYFYVRSVRGKGESFLWFFEIFENCKF